MFCGSFPAKIDEKSRLRLPAKFRQLIEEKENSFFVTSDNGECAQIYPWAVWEKIVEKLQEHPKMSPVKVKYQTVTNFYGLQTEMDPQGRILIPQRLRDKAQISGDVVVIGENDHMVVWNESIIQKNVEANPITQEDREALADLGI